MFYESQRGSVPGDLGINLACSSGHFPFLVHLKKKSAQIPPLPGKKGVVMCLCLTPNGSTPCCPQGSSPPLSATRCSICSPTPALSTSDP